MDLFKSVIKSKFRKFIKEILRLIDLISIQFIKSFYFKKNLSLKSASEYSQYPEFVLKAALDYKTFKIFRRHPIYTSILEHVSKNIGEKYLNLILDKYSLNKDEVLEIISPLQKIGCPKKFKLKGLPVPVSTTAIRYLKVALEIKENLLNKEEIDIVEIGCGYGGQALILNQVIKIRSYTFIDLWQVNMLIKRFLHDSFFDRPYQLCTLNDILLINKSWDLLISNYAFSELPTRLQEIYFDRVISKSKEGYMTMNSGIEGKFGQVLNMSKENLLKKIKSSYIKEEIPLTSDDNYIIRW